MLIHRHIISCGYADTAANMERECNIDLAKWDLADNMEMQYVLQDFEEYFEIKFQRKPVLCRRAAGCELDARGREKPKGGVNLPTIPKSGSRVPPKPSNSK